MVYFRAFGTVERGGKAVHGSCSISRHAMSIAISGDQADSGHSDPNELMALLQVYPWHVDTLLQMSEVYRLQSGKCVIRLQDMV